MTAMVAAITMAQTTSIRLLCGKRVSVGETSEECGCVERMCRDDVLRGSVVRVAMKTKGGGKIPSKSYFERCHDLTCRHPCKYVAVNHYFNE